MQGMGGGLAFALSAGPAFLAASHFEKPVSVLAIFKLREFAQLDYGNAIQCVSLQCVSLL